MKKKRLNEKGLSPVVATVLLVAMVIVIGLIIFLWFRGLTQEAVTKFGGTNIELVCEDVDFSASYTAGSLFISNIGNVPIYGFKVVVRGFGSFDTFDLAEDLDSNWPAVGLRQGGTYSTPDLSSELEGFEVTLIPVLIGTSGGGEKTHTCDNRFGQRVI